MLHEWVQDPLLDSVLLRSHRGLFLEVEGSQLCTAGVGLDHQEHQWPAHQPLEGAQGTKKLDDEGGAAVEGRDALQWIRWRTVMSAVVDSGQGVLVRRHSEGWSGIRAFCCGLPRPTSALLWVTSFLVKNYTLGQIIFHPLRT